jgi:hypothetical protein
MDYPGGPIFMMPAFLPHIYLACTVQSNSFFGLPSWWKFVPNTTTDGLGQCVPDFHFPNDIWAVALAVIDMLLWVAGIVAVISIIIAGVNFITSAGNPENAASARRRLVNALLGLLIALVAIGFISFIGNSIKG